MALFDADQNWLYSYLSIGRERGIYVPWLLSISIRKGLLDRFDSPFGYHKESPEQAFDAFSSLGLRPYKGKSVSDDQLHYLCFLLLKARDLLSLPFRKLPLRISFADAAESFDRFHTLDERKALSLLLLEKGESRADYLLSRKSAPIEDIDEESLAFLGASALVGLLPFRDYEDMSLSYSEGLSSLVMEGQRAFVCPFGSKKGFDESISSPGFPYFRGDRDGYLFLLDSSDDLDVNEIDLRALHGYGLLVLKGNALHFRKTGYGQYKAGLGSVRHILDFKKRSSSF